MKAANTQSFGIQRGLWKALRIEHLLAMCIDLPVFILKGCLAKTLWRATSGDFLKAHFQLH